MKQSAGLLVYRIVRNELEIFLVHSGGPFWAKKDLAAWSIPKGEFEEGEDPLQAAVREFNEETGLAVPDGKPVPLRPVKQSGRKYVHAWYLKGDFDASAVQSNTFEMEWPPRSGKQMTFPEVDKAGWFRIAEAREKVYKGQIPIIEQLISALSLDSLEP